MLRNWGFIVESVYLFGFILCFLLIAKSTAALFCIFNIFCENCIELRRLVHWAQWGFNTICTLLKKRPITISVNIRNTRTPEIIESCVASHSTYISVCIYCISQHMKTSKIWKKKHSNFFLFFYKDAHWLAFLRLCGRQTRSQSPLVFSLQRGTALMIWDFCQPASVWVEVGLEQ